MKPRRVDHAEMMRRMRLGDIRTLLRHRWGATVQDDDAGRDDLYWVVLYVSAGPDTYRKVPREIEKWAPWMAPNEATELIDRVNATPHLPSPKKLSAALGVTNGIRERLKIWRIPAFDMTPAQRRKWRWQKERQHKRLLRESRGAKPRAIYEAESKSKTQPWLLENPPISKATWYRRAKANRANGNGAINAKPNGTEIDDWRRKLPNEQLKPKPKSELKRG